MQWPPDFHAENLRRFRMMERAAGNLDLQGKVLAYYKHHPIEWMKDWCVTFDPRNEPPLPRLMPFIPFPRQAENIANGCWNAYVAKPMVLRKKPEMWERLGAAFMWLVINGSFGQEAS